MTGNQTDGLIDRSTLQLRAGTPRLSARIRVQWLPIWVSLLVLAATVAWIDGRGLGSSGPVWDDAPQYANAGAMIHDWLLSGHYMHPWNFALNNYARYPAFHMPYHPPFYPALLGLTFLFTGVTWTAARVLIAACLWVAGLAFFFILRRAGFSTGVSLAGTLLLVSTRLIAIWSRDAMSETPGLALVLVAVWFFLRWLDEGAVLWCALAVLAAEAAFLSRVLTAGVLPALFLAGLLARRTRRLILRPLPLLLWALFFGVNLAWVNWVKQFARFETFTAGTGPSVNYASPAVALSYYVSQIPDIIGILPLGLAIAGLVFVVRFGRAMDLIWPLWIICDLLFLTFVGIEREQRYFYYAVPGFIGLIAVTLREIKARMPSGAVLAVGAAVVALCLNIARIVTLPQGLTGYQPIAQAMSQLTEAGNFLIGSYTQSDLVFRFRGLAPSSNRLLLRADRVLAIRPPAYFDTPVLPLASTPDDVIRIVQKDRVRFLVTFQPADGKSSAEFRLLQETVVNSPGLFRNLGSWPLWLHWETRRIVGTVTLWRYTGLLPAGKADVVIVVPTSKMAIRP